MEGEGEGGFGWLTCILKSPPQNCSRQILNFSSLTRKLNPITLKSERRGAEEMLDIRTSTGCKVDVLLQCRRQLGCLFPRAVQ